MYHYRNMTPEQREAAVAWRREHGFAWHKPPHPPQGAGWYFITAATYEHKPYFSEPRELTALERRLLEAITADGFACGGWVVLPNHYHALVHADSPAAIGKALGPVHGRSSRYVNRRDHASGRKIWYKFSERKLRSERHYWACLHYIIANPVKHEYASELGDWPWSCYQEMLGEHGASWIDDLMQEYPLGDFGVTWDLSCPENVCNNGS